MGADASQHQNSDDHAVMVDEPVLDFSDMDDAGILVDWDTEADLDIDTEPGTLEDPQAESVSRETDEIEPKIGLDPGDALLETKSLFLFPQTPKTSKTPPLEFHKTYCIPQNPQTGTFSFHLYPKPGTMQLDFGR